MGLSAVRAVCAPTQSTNTMTAATVTIMPRSDSGLPGSASRRMARPMRKATPQMMTAKATLMNQGIPCLPGRACGRPPASVGRRAPRRATSRWR